MDPWAYLNPTLLKSPYNWAVIMIAASLWLLAFHVLMQGFTAMQQGGQAAFAGPGQVASPVAGTTAQFSAPGLLAAGVTAPAGTASSWWGGGLHAGDGVWTDGSEAKYAEDGWIANP